MTTTAAPGGHLPEPLAVDAAVAQSQAGPCTLCGQPVRRGQRYARLLVSGRLAHTACIGLAAGATAGRAA